MKSFKLDDPTGVTAVIGVSQARNGQRIQDPAVLARSLMRFRDKKVIDQPTFFC
jgi:hypothetical protein